MKDLAQLINIDRGFDPVVVTDNTAQATAIIDTQGFESITFVIATGTLEDANATFAVTMEHGDDSGLSDTAAPAAGDLIFTTTAAGFTYADDQEVRWIGYVGNKRYVRLTVTPSGNTGNAPLSCIVIKGHPHTAPTTMDS